MRISILYILFAVGIISCSKNEDSLEYLKDDKFPQKWVLTQMGDGMPISVTTGINMSWQEYYILNEDGTFLKSRNTEGEIVEEKGTYKFDLRKEGKYIITTFLIKNSLIGSCKGNLTEELWINSNSAAISSWSKCDGPSLIYERIY